MVDTKNGSEILAGHFPKMTPPYYIRIFEIVQETTFCAATFRRIFFQLPIVLKKLLLKKSGPAGLDLSKNAFKKTKKNLKNKPRGFPRKQVILS